MDEGRPAELGAKHPYRFVRSLGRGSYAEVFHAERRTDGFVAALKRALLPAEAHARIGREVEVQTRLAHPNIMPIFEHDLDGPQPWYTMPIADGTLDALHASLDDDGMASMLLDLAAALSVAHEAGQVHRDVAPGNILRLSGGTAPRWVVADWGMVTRPPDSSAAITRTGQHMGTPGFDAPELALDPSAALPTADVYSLGRIAAWLTTGRKPVSGVELLPEGDYAHWRHFVRECTFPDVNRRVASMTAFSEMLNNIFDVSDVSVIGRISQMTDDVLLGEAEKVDVLLSEAEAHSNSMSILVDHISRLPASIVGPWSVRASGSATVIATKLAEHLVTGDWGDRDLAYVTSPLNFLLSLLRAVSEAKLDGPTQDVATEYFRAEIYWSNKEQRDRTLDWLAELRSPGDVPVSRALGAVSGARSYYEEAGWQCESSVIRTVLS